MVVTHLELNTRLGALEALRTKGQNLLKDVNWEQ